MSRKGWIVLAIILSTGAGVLVFYAPRSLPESYLSNKEAQEKRKALEDFMATSRNDLIPAEKVMTRFWDKNLRAGQVTFADSLAAFWIRKNNPVMACKALEERAVQTEKPYYYEKAFDLYLSALEVAEPETLSLLLFALQEFASKALEKDSLMPSAHIALAVAEVRQSGAPMQGVMRLCRLLERDPSNRKALVQLGHFSVMSGQWDKALERYRAAWEAGPGDASVAFYLADTYARLGQTDSARRWLEKVKHLEANEATRTSVLNYFEENYNLSL